jgi:hypothetical protein
VMMNKPSHVSVLQGIRRDLEALLRRVDDALSDPGSQGPRPARQMPVPVDQTYIPGYDFRDNLDGLKEALAALHKRVQLITTHGDQFEYEDDFRNELCLRAAEARLFQIQAGEGTPEWETAVGVIRTLTRVVAEQRPGFIYGLSSTHNTDWGQKITDILAGYTPLNLGTDW